MAQCTHPYCRSVRAEELARMADATGRTRYLMDAVALLADQDVPVPCRQAGEAPARGLTPPARGGILPPWTPTSRGRAT